jgi:hypothetical protein
MDTDTHSSIADLDNSNNSFLSIHPGDKVGAVHLNKLRICTVVKHSDGKVYCKWRGVLLVRPFSQVVPK